MSLFVTFSVNAQMNVFVKPNEQSEARFDSAMARKGGMKTNV